MRQRQVRIRLLDRKEPDRGNDRKEVTGRCAWLPEQGRTPFGVCVIGVYFTSGYDNDTSGS